jgi:putative nucleotidyltransferase with HDIG domain
VIDHRELLDQIRALPALSRAVSELRRVLADDVATGADLAAAVRSDAGLAANVLRAANSAAFGLARRVTSIEHAVAMLGSSRLLDIAAAAALAGVVPDRLLGYGISATEFNQHCIAVAVLSDQLAAEINLVCKTEAFTAGLLHDVGKLAVSTFLYRVQDALPPALEQQQLALLQAEQQLLGIDHAAAGEAVIRKWQLPEVFAVTARWHHDPCQVTGEPTARALASVVHLADAMVHMLGLGADIAGLAREVKGEALSILDLDPSTVEAVACAATPTIQELCSALAPAGSGAQVRENGVGKG